MRNVRRAACSAFARAPFPRFAQPQAEIVSRCPRWASAFPRPSILPSRAQAETADSSKVWQPSLVPCSSGLPSGVCRLRPFLIRSLTRGRVQQDLRAARHPLAVDARHQPLRDDAFQVE